MKNCVALSFVLLFITVNSFAFSGDPVKEISTVVFESSDIDLRVMDLENRDAIVNAIYNKNNEFFTLETMKSIKYVQILNEKGELEYQIPVDSNFLNISMEDFTKGAYAVNLLFEGKEDYFVTKLVKKK